MKSFITALDRLVADLNELNAYLRGAPAQTLEECMRYYEDEIEELRANYCQIDLESDERIVGIVKTLLRNLNIPEASWDKYLKLSPYDLLLRLNAKGYHQISYMLELIDEKTAIKKLPLFINGTLLISSIVPLLFLSIFSGIFTALEALLTSVIGLPILGLIYTTTSALYKLYQNQFDKSTTLFNRLRDNFFLLANTAVNVIAYGFWIAAAAPMTTLVASLFVIASAVDVAKELFSLAQETYRYFNSSPINPNDPVIVHQTYARNVYGFRKHLTALMINLAASTLLLGIMAAWCFVPGGLIVTLCAIAAIAVVYGIKTTLLKAHASRIRDQLQSQLTEIEAGYHPNIEQTLDGENLQTLSTPSEQFVTTSTLILEEGHFAEISELIPDEHPSPTLSTPSEQLVVNAKPIIEDSSTETKNDLEGFPEPFAPVSAPGISLPSCEGIPPNRISFFTPVPSTSPVASTPNGIRP